MLAANLEGLHEGKRRIETDMFGEGRLGLLASFPGSILIKGVGGECMRAWERGLGLSWKIEGGGKKVAKL